MSLPFGIMTINKLLKQILEIKYTLSKELSKDAKDLISKLLDLNPKTRLGCGKSEVEEIKQHQFFDGIDWNSITQKNNKPPFVPLLKSESDIENIDNFYKSHNKVFNMQSDTNYITDSDATIYDNYTFIRNTSNIIEEKSPENEFSLTLETNLTQHHRKLSSGLNETTSTNLNIEFH